MKDETDYTKSGFCKRRQKGAAHHKFVGQAHSLCTDSESAHVLQEKERLARCSDLWITTPATHTLCSLKRLLVL